MKKLRIRFRRLTGKFDVTHSPEGRGCIVLKTFDNITAARAYRDSLKEGE